MTKPTASKTSPGSSDLFDRQMAALRAEAAARAAEHDAKMAELERELERRQTTAKAQPQEPGHPVPIRQARPIVGQRRQQRPHNYWTCTNIWHRHPTPGWVQFLPWAFVAFVVLFTLAEHA